MGGREGDEISASGKLQRAVNDIEGWCRRWRVKLNGEKSNFVIIGKKKKKQDENLGILLFNDVVRPVSKARFLGLEITESLSFTGHIQDLAQKAEGRLNILKILAWGGTDPKTLIRLYKVYCRSIFEYGSIAFLHISDTTMNIMQKVQNKAIRIALRLPNYISIKLLHEYACLPMIKERLQQLGSNHLGKMASNNELIKNMIKERGFPTEKRSHRSPLDILLPVQRPTPQPLPSTTK